MTTIGWIIIAVVVGFIIFLAGLFKAAIIASTKEADLKHEIIRLSRENDALRMKLGIELDDDIHVKFGNGAEVSYPNYPKSDKFGKICSACGNNELEWHKEDHRQGDGRFRPQMHLRCTKCNQTNRILSMEQYGEINGQK